MTKKDKNTLEFYVLVWDANFKRVERFNVFNSIGPMSVPGKITTWSGDILDAVDNGEIANKKDLVKWLGRWFKDRYWARCQYEILVSDWLSDKNQEKIDVYYQLEKNLDVIAGLVIDKLDLEL